jgi:hypothetical protein
MQCDNQPARLKRGVNYLLFRRLRAARQKVMQGRGGTTRGNATTSQQTRGKREEMHQQTKGDGALIGQGCVLRGGGRVNRTRGGGIDTTTSWKMRGNRGSSNGNSDGNMKCRAPPSHDLATIALVLTAEAAAALIADDANGGNGRGCTHKN